MPIKPYYDKILTEHNMRPKHKHPLPAANLELCGSNPNCGDRITLHLLIDDNKRILDGSFTGDGCAVAQASADLMLERIIGGTLDDAVKLSAQFRMMMSGAGTEKDEKDLGPAAAMKSISGIPSRIRCAVLGWRALEQILPES